MKSKFYYPGIWKYIVVITLTSQEIHGVSNLGNLNCLLNNFVGLAIEESSEPRIIGPIRGNHRPHNACVTQKHFPCHDVMVFISNVNFKPDWSLLCTSVSLSARIIDPPPPPPPHPPPTNYEECYTTNPICCNIFSHCRPLMVILLRMCIHDVVTLMFRLANLLTTGVRFRNNKKIQINGNS